MTLIDDRFERQREIVPRDRLTDVRTTVIGVGAIGRQLAIQLASIGVCHIQLIDFDHVERILLQPARVVENAGDHAGANGDDTGSQHACDQLVGFEG